MKTKRILLHLAILALAIVSIASGSYGIYHLRYYDSKENCLHRYTESYASVTSGVIEEIVDNRIYREKFMDPNKVVAKVRGKTFFLCYNGRKYKGRIEI